MSSWEDVTDSQVINIEVYQYVNPSVWDKLLLNFCKIFTASSSQGKDTAASKNKIQDLSQPQEQHEKTQIVTEPKEAIAEKKVFKPVIVIALFSKEVFEQFQDEYVHTFSVLHEAHPDFRFSDKLYFYVIEVSKCPDEKTSGRLQRWLQYLRNKKVPGPGALRYSEEDEIFANLEVIEMDFVKDYDSLDRYVRSRKMSEEDEMLMNEALDNVRAEASLEKGFAIAKNMFSLGMETAKIKMLTGLPEALLNKAQQGGSLTQEDFRRFA